MPPINRQFTRTPRTAAEKSYLPTAPTQLSRLREVSDAMKWVQERSVVLGIMALGTTTWLWMDFSATYGLGIGVFSGSVLGALPSLLICATFFGLLLTLIFLLPALTLLVEVGEGRPKLAELDARPDYPARNARDEPPFSAVIARTEIRGPRVHRRTVFHAPSKSVKRWACVSAFQTTLVSAALFLPFIVPSFESHSTAVAACCMVEAIALPAIVFARHVGGRQSFEFHSLTVGSISVQVQISALVVLGIGPMILGNETTVKPMVACLCTLLFAAITASIAAGQVLLIGAARLLVTGKNIVIRALIVGQLVLLASAAVAPIGAWLIYVPIRIMGMNAMRCAVLPIIVDDEKKVPPVLVRKGGGTTVNLSFVTPVIDEVRFVQVQGQNSNATVALPKGSVGQPVACPSS